MSHLLNSTLAVAVAVGLVSCAFGAAGPKPLSVRFSDRSLATVAPSERSAVLEAKRAHEVAGMELETATFALEEVASELAVANNQRSQAALEERSAKTTKQAADRSQDMARINAGEGADRDAKIRRRAADEKVTYLKAEQAYRKKVIEWRLYDVYAKDAKVELAKARTAKEKNISPRGFDYAEYDRQYNDRSAAAAAKKREADKAARAAQAKRKTWEASSKLSNRL